MNKVVLVCFGLFVGFIAQSQEKFEKDGKWGISKNGGEDSVIFRAEFEEIIRIDLSEVSFFKGLKNKEWYPLTSNKLVNQQRYEQIISYPFVDRYIFCSRDGYIDVIDMGLNDFLIRGVQANEIIDYDLADAPNNLIVTQKDKLIGAINVDTKKELFKAKYSSIKLTQTDIGDVPYLTYFEGKNSLYDTLGNLKFTISVEDEIMYFEQFDDIQKCYVIINAKGLNGYYEANKKWFIPMEYESLTAIDPGKSDIIVVKGKKGKGLYFEGKLMVEPIYTEILISDQRGYLAILIDKKGKEFYLSPEGKISSK